MSDARNEARRDALSVAHLWDAPEVVIEYLETGDEDLWDSAMSAVIAYYDSSQAKASRLRAKEEGRPCKRNLASFCAFYAIKVGEK
jgi:hypothetical protein